MLFLEISLLLISHKQLFFWCLSVCVCVCVGEIDRAAYMHLTSKLLLNFPYRMYSFGCLCLRKGRSYCLSEFHAEFKAGIITKGIS